LEGPKRHLRGSALGVDRIGVVVPLENREFGLPNIRVADIEDRKIGDFVVDDDGKILSQYAGCAG
jgi:hypothetical protein